MAVPNQGLTPGDRAILHLCRARGLVMVTRTLKSALAGGPSADAIGTTALERHIHLVERFFHEVYPSEHPLRISKSTILAALRQAHERARKREQRRRERRLERRDR